MIEGQDEAPKRRGAWRRPDGLAPAMEIGAVVLVVAMVALSYYVVTRAEWSDTWLSPPAVAALLVANLVPAMALMVLIARRFAKRRAARSGLGGGARLHVRLVAFFSVLASVPTLLVVIFASILFQSGVQFWFSDQARTVLERAGSVSDLYVNENKDRITREVIVMGSDVVANINEFGLDSPSFRDSMFFQVVNRDLSEAAIFSVSSRGELQTQAVANLDDRPIEERLPPPVLSSLRSGQPRVVTDAGDRIEAVIRLDPEQELYLYISRALNAEALRQWQEARNAASDYAVALNRSRDLQLRFNAALLLVSLLIVAIAIWVALAVADRLVRPVGELVGAARRISAGDLTTRVPESGSRDEIATLGEAFNAMTGQLEEQTGALVSANNQLESRRAFMEAVLSGVTAGVLSVDAERVVRLVNSTAESLLGTSGRSPIGQRLADVAPELDRLLSGAQAEGIVQFATNDDSRTLSVKTVVVDRGHVLTFDDITEQLIDQRRAAWSDVAQRIAHEIKNPLTPIQLAAERLQRRYGREISSDPPTFERLTGTIVRQVGDLRRMVDEFSSFARMPKPVFHEEALVDIARQALFLHEVAHPDIRFSLEAPEPAPTLVCDRRLIGQALTNIVKNGVEAIQQKREENGTPAEADRITITLARIGARLMVEVTDTGVGLPPDRRRLTEPYMTTRTKGTGLGLAIVKKIVEEHFGTMEFADAPGGGTCVRLAFDAGTLSRIGAGGVRTLEAAVNG